jgi:hypothetical protein
MVETGDSGVAMVVLAEVNLVRDCRALCDVVQLCALSPCRLRAMYYRSYATSCAAQVTRKGNQNSRRKQRKAARSSKGRCLLPNGWVGSDEWVYGMWVVGSRRKLP